MVETFPTSIGSARPFWHEYNPWNDRLIYVPIEELASCQLKIADRHDPWGMINVIAQWTQYGDKLDAYILINSVEMTGGVRFGPQPHDYLSPGFSLPKLWALRQKYR